MHSAQPASRIEYSPRTRPSGPQGGCSPPRQEQKKEKLGWKNGPMEYEPFLCTAAVIKSLKVSKRHVKLFLPPTSMHDPQRGNHAATFWRGGGRCLGLAGCSFFLFPLCVCRWSDETAKLIGQIFSRVVRYLVASIEVPSTSEGGAVLETGSITASITAKVSYQIVSCRCPKRRGTHTKAQGLAGSTSLASRSDLLEGLRRPLSLGALAFDLEMTASPRFFLVWWLEGARQDETW